MGQVRSGEHETGRLVQRKGRRGRDGHQEPQAVDHALDRLWGGGPVLGCVEGQNRLSSAFARSQARLARTQESRRAARKSRPKNGWPATALNNTGASKEPARA